MAAGERRLVADVLAQADVVQKCRNNIIRSERSVGAVNNPFRLL